MNTISAHPSAAQPATITHGATRHWNHPKPGTIVATASKPHSFISPAQIFVGQGTFGAADGWPDVVTAAHALVHGHDTSGDKPGVGLFRHDGRIFAHGLVTTDLTRPNELVPFQPETNVMQDWDTFTNRNAAFVGFIDGQRRMIWG